MDLFTNTFSQTPFCLYVLFYCVPFVFVVLYVICICKRFDIICICKRFENKTQIKVTIKDASTAGKVGFELLSGNAPPLLLLRSSDIGRCKARAADMWTITNTFQPQDVGQGAAPKRWRRYEDDMNYLGRKELRAALPELGDLFMRRVNFSEQLVHWPSGQVLKGSRNF